MADTTGRTTRIVVMVSGSGTNLQAIMDGRGIGIGWRYLLDDYIEAGRLRLAHGDTAPGERGYHCYLMERARDNPAATSRFPVRCPVSDEADPGRSAF